MKKKIKNLPMRFNSALLKFEPDLSANSKNEKGINWKMYIYFILAVLVVMVLLVILRGNEDSWIKDSRGVWIKHGNPATIPQNVLEQQAAIGCAQRLFEEKNKIENLSSQCLGSCLSYSVDIVHVPRTSDDNFQENQCSEYINKITTHFIELDKYGTFVRVV